MPGIVSCFWRFICQVVCFPAMHKIHYLFSVLLVLHAGFALAQSKEFGLKASSAFTQVQFNPTIDQSSQRNLYGGMAFRFLNAKNAGVQVELNYGRRSYREEIDSLSFTGRAYDVIELPLMTHVRFGRGKFSSYMHVGSLIDYVIGAQEENFANEELITEPYTLDPAVDNRWNYALAGGFGLSYAIGPGLLQAEGRYAYYFGSIEKSLLVTRFSQPRSVQVSLSYFVNLPKIQLFKKKEDNQGMEEEPINAVSDELF